MFNTLYLSHLGIGLANLVFGYKRCELMNLQSYVETVRVAPKILEFYSIHVYCVVSSILCPN